MEVLKENYKNTTHRRRKSPLFNRDASEKNSSLSTTSVTSATPSKTTDIIK